MIFFIYSYSFLWVAGQTDTPLGYFEVNIFIIFQPTLCCLKVSELTFTDSQLWTQTDQHMPVMRKLCARIFFSARLACTYAPFCMSVARQAKTDMKNTKKITMIKFEQRENLPLITINLQQKPNRCNKSL